MPDAIIPVPIGSSWFAFNMDGRHFARSFIQIAICFITIIILSYVPINEAAFSMTILHTGDIHARFQQFDRFAGICSPIENDNGECYGGFARLRHAIKDIRESEENVLVLDAGDIFSGTLWFTQYQGKASAHFMNRLEYDAQTIGNHELDEGPQIFGEYLKNLTSPMVCANIDVSREPVLEGLISPSVVITVGGQRVGVVGYILPATAKISETGNIVFTNEVDALQAEVDRLREIGINKIIALGHSGFAKDQEIAAKVKGVDIVVGGHSSTFLYTGTPPDVEVPRGDYPYLVASEDGHTVPIVHAYDFGKYLGRLDVTFDDDDNLIGYQGNPILLNKDIEQDITTLTEINKWAESIESVTNEMVGRTHVHLNGNRESCRQTECNMGNLITDAFLWSAISEPTEDEWNDVAITIIAGGGIRSSIAQGEIILGDILQVLPFGNTVDILDLKGEYIKEMLENSIAEYNPDNLDGAFLQVSGIWVTYDLSRDINDRVVDLQVRCTNCTIPEFKPLDEEKMYRIAMPTYTANGGDRYDVIANNAQNRYSGRLAATVVSDYIQLFSPVYPGIERRISFVEADKDDKRCDEPERNPKKKRKRIP